MIKTNIYLLLSAFVLSSLSVFAQTTTNEGNTKFAFEYYKELTRLEEHNFIFSPQSISSALSMSYLGAVGETKDEIQQVFSFDSDPVKNFQNNSQLGKDDNGEVKLVNTIWAQKGYDLKKDYVKTLEANFKESVKYVDYVSSSQVSRVMINNWVSKSTNGKIRNLLGRRAVDARTRLIQVNALYFKGKWLNPFDKGQTQDNTFILADNKRIRATYMRNDAKQYNYYQDNQVQVIELPYEGYNYSMVVVLPRNQKTFDIVEGNLSIATYNNWLNNFSQRAVKVNLPKFKLGASMDAGVRLAAMGMPTAFTQRANFGNMSVRNDLQIQKIVHKSVIEVSEEGTEAAASTAVSNMAKGIDNLPSAIFNANRPFIFMIKENKTNNVLFIGRFMTPMQEEVEIKDEPKDIAATNYNKGVKRYPATPRIGRNNASTTNTGTSYNQPQNKIIPLKGSLYVNSKATPNMPSATTTTSYDRPVRPTNTIPIAIGTNTSTSTNAVKNGDANTTIHVVRTGETLYQIARKNKVSAKDILTWNNMTSERIEIGQRLIIKKEKEEKQEKVTLPPGTGVKGSNSSSPKRPIFHTVRKGENLYQIAQKYDMKVKELKAINKLTKNDLSIGQQLQLSPLSQMTIKGGTALNPSNQDLECNCFKHKVAKGETLFGIAQKYKKTVQAIKFVNKMETNDLSIGQELIIEK